MKPHDLIDDLKLRINPQYADQRGTESYERRLCVEAIESQDDEITKLRQQRDELAKCLWPFVKHLSSKAVIDIAVRTSDVQAARTALAKIEGAGK